MIEYDKENETKKNNEEKSTASIMPEVERWINYMGFDYTGKSEILANGYLRMHRTLQQSFIRLIAMTIKRLGQYYKDNPYSFDDRNKSAAQWIEKVSKIDDEYFPFI